MLRKRIRSNHENLGKHRHSRCWLENNVSGVQKFVLANILAFHYYGKVPRDGGLPLAICRPNRMQTSVCFLR